MNNFDVILRGNKTEFSPSDISDLTFWYGDYVNDGVLRTTLSDNTNITQWDDQSGNGYDAFDGYGSVLYKSSTDAIYFNQSELKTSTQFSFGNQERTLFTIATNKRTTNGLSVVYNIGFNSTDFFELTIQTISVSGTFCYPISYNGVYNVNYPISTHNYNPNDLHLYTEVIDDRTSQYYINRYNCRIDGNLLSNKLTNLNVYLNTGTDYFRMGRYHESSLLSDVEIKEFLWYSRELNSTEIEQVETFLNNKYSIF